MAPAIIDDQPGDRGGRVPTYEYECRSCKRTFEVQHRISDAPPAACQECGGELRRVFYPPGLVFKGTGFYSTDGRFGRTSDKRESVRKDESKPFQPGNLRWEDPPPPAAGPVEREYLTLKEVKGADRAELRPDP